MTTPPLGHQTVIASALDTWWLHSDLARPLDHTEAARQIEEHLIHAGYYIAPYALKAATMPSRRTLTGVALVTLLVAASSLFCLIRGEWLMTLLGAAMTGAFARETLRAARHRRSARR